MQRFIITKALAFSFLLLVFPGCKKFLEKKPDKSLVIPSRVEDLQAVLDNNANTNRIMTGLGEGSSDNYYLTTEIWNSLTEAGRNTYVWEDDVYAGIVSPVQDPYGTTYGAVYLANRCLESLNSIPRTSANAVAWDNVKGSSFFYRARSFFVALLTWAEVYRPGAENSGPGVPLRLDPDFNIISTRATVEEGYQQVIDDLQDALRLLPDTGDHPMRPSKCAAFALLSRVYLSMGDYAGSLRYADSALDIKDGLMEYAALNAAASYPIRSFNEEVIFFASATIPNLSPSNAKIDSNLFRSYDENDLRKRIFFRDNGDGSVRFKGQYTGASTGFTGLCTDELYLNKAECLARLDRGGEAMDVLNLLLETRWDPDRFVPFESANSEEALDIILTERRKELLMRDIRWMDLKRLNLDPGRAVTIRREVGGQVFELPPNDKRYALAFPPAVIAISGMPQNER